MLGYGLLASAAHPGRAAHRTATDAKTPNAIVLTIFRFIDFLLRYEFQYAFETYDSYIPGAAVPSDHLLTGITNSVMGSGPP
jgi:hypothetical protein